MKLKKIAASLSLGAVLLATVGAANAYYPTCFWQYVWGPYGYVYSYVCY